MGGRAFEKERGKVFSRPEPGTDPGEKGVKGGKVGGTQTKRALK